MQYALPLATSMLNGIDERFSDLFQDEEAQLASAIHPRFKLTWLTDSDEDQAFK